METNSRAVKTSLLHNDELDKVCKSVDNLKDRWKILGGCLGIESSKLDAIEKGTCEDNQMREMLAYWLSCHESSTTASNDHDPGGGSTSTDDSTVPATGVSPQKSHFGWWKPSWKALSIAVRSIDEDVAMTIIQNNSCDCHECLDAACIRDTPVSLCVQKGDAIGAAETLCDDFDEILTHAGRRDLRAIITPDKLRQCLVSYLECRDGIVHMPSEHHLEELKELERSKEIIDHLIHKSFISYFNYNFLKMVFIECCSTESLELVSEYSKNHFCFLNLSLEKLLKIFQDKEFQLQPPKGLPVLTLHLESKWSKRSMYELMAILEQHITHTHITPLECLIFVDIMETSTSTHGFDITYAVWPRFISAIGNGLMKEPSNLKLHGIIVDLNELKPENFDLDDSQRQDEMQISSDVTSKSISIKWNRSNCELDKVLYCPTVGDHSNENMIEVSDNADEITIDDLQPSQEYELNLIIKNKRSLSQKFKTLPRFFPAPGPPIIECFKDGMATITWAAPCPNAGENVQHYELSYNALNASEDSQQTKLIIHEEKAIIQVQHVDKMHFFSLKAHYGKESSEPIERQLLVGEAWQNNSHDDKESSTPVTYTKEVMAGNERQNEHGEELKKEHDHDGNDDNDKVQPTHGSLLSVPDPRPDVMIIDKINLQAELDLSLSSNAIKIKITCQKPSVTPQYMASQVYIQYYNEKDNCKITHQKVSHSVNLEGHDVMISLPMKNFKAGEIYWFKIMAFIIDTNEVEESEQVSTIIPINRPNQRPQHKESPHVQRHGIAMVPQGSIKILKKSSKKLLISWEKPLYNLDLIQRYEIKVWPNQKSSMPPKTFYTTTNKSQYEFEGLNSNTQYYIEIVGEGKENKGQFPTSFTFHTDPPMESPGELTLSKKDTNLITLQLAEAPPSQHLDFIQRYVISCYSREGELLSHVMYSKQKLEEHHRQHTFTKLNPRTAYIIGIKGLLVRRNTKEIFICIQTNCSSRPKALKCVEVDTNHTKLQWNHPEKYAENVEKYLVEYSDYTKQPVKLVPVFMPNTCCYVENLSQNTTYEFKVRASCGEPGADSPPAEISVTTKKTVSGPPGKPYENKTVHTFNEIHLKWDKPVSHSQYVKYYQLISRNLNAENEESIVAETTEEHIKLTYDKFKYHEVYCFKVRAACSNKEFSEYSIKSDPIQCKPLPEISDTPAPISRSDTSITLSWRKIKYFRTVSYYTVMYAEKGFSDEELKWDYKDTNSNKSVEINGLEPDTSYYFKVKAKSKRYNEYGPESEVTEIETTLPCSSIPVCKERTHTFVTLTWNAPVEIKKALLHYKIKFMTKDSENESKCWNTYSEKFQTTEAQIFDLKGSTEHRFKVAAFFESDDDDDKEDFSESEHSDWIRPYLYPNPGPPKNLNISKVTQITAELEWDEPNENCQYVTSYNVFKCEVDHERHFDFKLEKDEVLEKKWTITGLNPETEYQFKIKALNFDGNGHECQALSVKTDRRAPGPTGKPFVLSVTHNTAKLVWEMPNENPDMVGYYRVLSYTSDYGDTGTWKANNESQCNETSFEVHDLESSKRYFFKVIACTEDGYYDKKCDFKISDQIMTLSAVPSEPGKPKGEADSFGEITLSWNRPKYNYDNISYYEIYYFREGETLQDKLLATTTKKGEEECTINRLTSNSDINSKVGYYFTVTAVTDKKEESKPSLQSDLITNEKAIAVRFFQQNEHRVNKQDETPPVYLLEKDEMPQDHQDKMARQHQEKVPQAEQHEIFSIKLNTSPLVSRNTNNKVFMLVGSTGDGKSTLINAMINYIMRVKFNDNFRLKLIHEPNVTQTKSVTKIVSAYIVHYESGFEIPYTLTIIDTPGFGDTAGIERDREITKKIKDFFDDMPHGIDHLDGVGFVCKSSSVRLTPAQRHIFESMLTLFGKDVKNNIKVLCTFDDGTRPMVLKAIERYGVISVDEYYKFNNSALYDTTSNPYAEGYWHGNVDNFRKLLLWLEKVEPVSFALTRDVLEHRLHLEELLMEFIKKMHGFKLMIDQLQNDFETIDSFTEQNIKDGDKVEIKKVSKVEVPLPSNESAHNCKECEVTCHYPCTYSNSVFNLRKGCKVMKKMGKKKQCTKCKCPWENHHIDPFKFEEEEQKAKETFYEFVKKRINIKATELEKMTKEEVKELLKCKIDKEFEKLIRYIDDANNNENKIKEIALHQNCYSGAEYIKELIEYELQHKTTGFSKRVQQLKDLQEIANFYSKASEFKDKRDKYKKRWWENGFLELYDQINILNTHHVHTDSDPSLNMVSEILIPELPCEVSVYGEKFVQIREPTCKSHYFINWNGFGLKIIIPPDALEKDVIYTIALKVIEINEIENYKLPENVEVVSALYWVYSSHKFLKPVTMEIQHCAQLSVQSALSQMKIVTAKYDEGLPYKFHKRDGDFHLHSCQGKFSTQQFSFFAIVWESLFGLEAPINVAIDYVYMILGKKVQGEQNLWHFDLYFMKNIDPFIEKINRKRDVEKWIDDTPATQFHFNDNSEDIDIALSSEREHPSGWKITQKPCHKISKSKIDHCFENTAQQYCRIVFQWIEDSNPDRLDYTITLNGITVGSFSPHRVTLSVPCNDDSNGSTGNPASP